MEIIKKDIDQLNATITVKIEKEDYQEKVDNKIREYRRQAIIPGFRQGKVPPGIIKKMYGTQILIEEVNKLLSKNLSKYIDKNKLDIIGNPLPNKDEQKEIDWNRDESFEFIFDIGLIPPLDIELTKEDKIPFYEIEPDDEMIQSYKDNYANRLGKYVDCKAPEDESVIWGDFVQVDEKGNIMEKGIRTDNGFFMVSKIADEDFKKNVVMKAKTNDTIDFELNKAFTNPVDVASMLKVDQKKFVDKDIKMRLTINEIKNWEPAEINQELFDIIYGENVVKNDEEFSNKIVDELKKNLVYDSNSKFIDDAKKMLLDKFKFDLSKSFLKQHMISNYEKMTEEEFDKNAERYLEMYKWQILKNKISNYAQLKIEPDEIMEYAKMMVKAHFQSYGMEYVPEENVENYTKELLQNDEERIRIIDVINTDKITEFLKNTITLDIKKTTRKKFEELLKEND